jgi:hypothetical protein
MPRPLVQLVLPGFVVVVGGKRRRGRPVSYWKKPPEFKRDLEKVDEELLSGGQRPTNTRRAKALHVNEDTLYVWLGKLKDYEREQQETHLRAVGE